MNYATRVASFIVARCAADATLAAIVGNRVFAHPVPAGEALPAVTFFQLVGDTQPLLGETEGYGTVLMLIRGITSGEDLTQAIAISDRLDAVFNFAEGTAGADATVFACVKERDHFQSEVEGDVWYRHVGGEFRFYVRRT